MRALRGALALGVMLTLCTPLRAQSATSQFFPTPATGSFFPSGSVPSTGFGATGPIVNAPVNTSGLSVVPSNTNYLQSFFNTTAGVTQQAFNTSAGLVQGFFHAVTFGAWPPTQGSSSLPSPTGAIQPVLPGSPPIIYTSGIQPVMPITP
jgi:hypothetical protein